MVQWVKVIETFSTAENSTIAEAANFISDELINFKEADFYSCFGGVCTLIPEENDHREPERNDEVLELFNSRYYLRKNNETTEDMESRAWKANSYYSYPNHVINFAKSIFQDAPNGAQAIIDFISLQLTTKNQSVNINAEEKPKQLQEVEKPLHTSFDKASTTYPTELDLAMQAWQAVTSSEGKGKPKARIRAWLDSNTKNISNEAKERISIVANWDKSGGATTTD